MVEDGEGKGGQAQDDRRRLDFKWEHIIEYTDLL